jgi:Leucine-rich repeat (LRR) protein
MTIIPETSADAPSRPSRGRQALERRREGAPHENWLADDGLRALGQCKRLTALSLSNTLITDAGVAELRHLDQLAFLEISSPHVTGKSLKTIAALPNLVTLTLAKWRLGADDLAALEAMPNLTWLTLRTDLSDDFVPRLAKLTQLDSLYLDGPGLTDACLPHFYAFKNLHRLDLSGTNVNPLGPAAQNLRKALPNCSISLPWTLQQKRQFRVGPPSAVQRASP